MRLFPPLAVTGVIAVLILLFWIERTYAPGLVILVLDCESWSVPGEGAFVQRCQRWQVALAATFAGGLSIGLAALYGTLQPLKLNRWWREFIAVALLILGGCYTLLSWSILLFTVEALRQQGLAASGPQVEEYFSSAQTLSFWLLILNLACWLALTNGLAWLLCLYVQRHNWTESTVQ